MYIRIVANRYVLGICIEIMTYPFAYCVVLISFSTCNMSLGVQSKIRHSFSSVYTVTLLFFLSASNVPVEK